MFSSGPLQSGPCQVLVSIAVMWDPSSRPSELDLLAAVRRGESWNVRPCPGAQAVTAELLGLQLWAQLEVSPSWHQLPVQTPDPGWQKP